MGWFVGLIVVLGLAIVVWRYLKPKKLATPPRRPPGPIPTARVRPSSASANRSEPTQSRKPIRANGRFPITWFGEGTELEVGGFHLKSPCVYASSEPDRSSFWATDPSEILIQSPIQRPSGQAMEMPYWPWYSRVTETNRYEYLSWLSSGKSTLPWTDGYLFLYFYGIERRLLVDQVDRSWALNEVLRLRRLDEPRVGTKAGRSFRQYSSCLLWFELARTPASFDRRAFDLLAKMTPRWTPELLTSPLAWLAAREQPLPANLARQIAAADPTSQRSVVIKRLTTEFEELFEARYREMFGGDGMLLRVSKRSAWHTYKPASGGLTEVRCEVPNPLGLPSQFKALPDIWNSCIADLRRLSRVTASSASGPISVEAWEAMPEELRSDIDHPLSQAVALIVESSVDRAESAPEVGIASMVPAGRFAELIGIEQRPTLTATQSQKLAATITHAGFGVVPDARISPIRYGWNDLVALVPGLDAEVEPTRYNAAVCVLRLGLFVAMADGTADEVELRMLTDYIDAIFSLAPEEQQRLSVLRQLLLRTGSDPRCIPAALKATPEDARRKVGRLLVAIAATNGIGHEERASLRRAFRALDLKPELLEDTITEIVPGASEAEVSVRPPSIGGSQDELIPVPTISFRLNHAAISTIMAETREVSVLLAAAMGTLEPESDTPEAKLAHKSPNDLPFHSPSVTGASETSQVAAVGPGGRYDGLFRALLARPRWPRHEADLVARSCGQMLDAGIEAINDWAFETLGAPLIEDDADHLVLDHSLLDAQQGGR